MTEKAFPAPREMRVLSIVQIGFMHKESNRHMMCKVDITRLNGKLQKLQNEGMAITGIYFTDLEKEHAYIPHPTVDLADVQKGDD